MRNLTIFTIIIALMSIIKVYEQDYDELQAEHDNCYRVVPMSHQGNIDTLKIQGTSSRRSFRSHSR